LLFIFLPSFLKAKLLEKKGKKKKAGQPVKFSKATYQISQYQKKFNLNLQK
jgi:hypothetical protein